MDCYTYVLEQLHQDDVRRLRSFSATGAGSFTTWLVVVARRLIQDHHRRRYGRPSRSSRGDAARRKASAALRRNLAEMMGEEFAPWGREDCVVVSPEAAAEEHERVEALRTAVESLAPRDQLLLKLRYEQELTAQQIARVLGFPGPFHVYRRLRRVLRVLGSCLHPAYADVSH